MYYEIDRNLSEKIKSKKWSSRTIDALADSINRSYPNLKGFTRRGLYRMAQFYETYKDYKNVSTLLTQISWINNIIIFSSTSCIEERILY